MRCAPISIHVKAKRHASNALAFGWTSEAMITDYVQQHLVLDGYTTDKAERAAKRAWDNLQIQPPN